MSYQKLNRSYEGFIQHMLRTYPDKWPALEQQLVDLFKQPNGNWHKLGVAIDNLPKLSSSKVQFDAPQITIGDISELSAADREQLLQSLQKLKPWRKGPFNVFGIDIDSEWQCDYKWQRVKQQLGSLAGKTILDIGSGNGYYAWRMLAEKPETVIAIDPSVLSVIQYHCIHKLLLSPPDNFALLPFSFEDIPDRVNIFDTIFSMGVLYHRTSPIDHLRKIRDLLKPGGQLVIETLVVEGVEGYSLTPATTYAKMRNVWFIPSVKTLVSWLAKCNYLDIDVGETFVITTQEQRSTNWASPASLKDFLDPDDYNKTVEGHPAPRRIIVVAKVRA